jgi:filamentous hemagglutinin family protein
MKPLTHNRKSIWFAALVFLASRAPQVFANPTGLTVAGGSASAQSSGSQLNITVSQSAVLNWGSFNIARGETTTFLQPSSDSVVLNVIGGANPSQIYGSLNANGTVILENANGFYFGPNSMIKVGGSFIATTAPTLPDFGSSSAWQFTGMPPLASIVNYGQIEVGQGRSLFLIAENIENHGSLTAPDGNIDLAAGQSVLVSETPDGRGLSATVTLPSGSVDNFGRITADAGTIALQAKVVNQDGVLQANSIQNQNGVIELVASDTVNLGANSQILAQGDSSAGGSAGGNVTIKAGNTFSDATGSTISTAGGANGGNGGNVEISAPNVASLNSTMDATAQAGWTGGTFFLDPVNIILGTSTAGGAINVNTAFAGFSSIDLQASGNITINQNTSWNLSGSTGQTAGSLTLQAGGNITFGNSSKITDANGWSVALEAGYNFGTHSINSGVGNIYLNGGSGKTQNGTIQLGSGDVTLEAGQSILVGTGSVFTTGGGSIYAAALAGDINCGTANGGYQFGIFGYSPVATLGGISTARGGDVTLISGNNVISQPTTPANTPPGASGAYGAGNVTIIAGNQVMGNYTLANGLGTILAGASVAGGTVNILNSAASIGTEQRPVNLSLISGSWNAYSGGNIYIGEVRNPNGTFNPNRLAVPAGLFSGNTDGFTVPANSSFLFDYAPNAAANLWAGDGITLVGANLPRINGQNNSMPPIYAPVLSLNAGAGGVTLENSIILAPSSQGSLAIITRDGGNLTGAVQGTSLTGIIMSDSGLPGWASFAQGHANTPLHLNNPNPVTLDISGSIESFGLTVPTFANITVGGDTYNFGFLGQNLSLAQTTSINVAGNITYRGDLTSETLSDPISTTLFNAVVAGDPAASGYLRYDAATGTLTYVGVMSSSAETALLNPVDAKGNPVAFTPAQLIVWQAGITALYGASQTATLGDQGLAVSGPGNFDITANRIDLGISGGITSLAPSSALAAISPDGANISVTTVGDLSMTSSKVANESYLGGIMLNVGGTLDVGGEFTTFGDPNAPKGIFTTSGGNISVIANADVNVNGSRIAAYNGGNVTVESLNGNINAGTGGAGYVTMTALQLNKKTGQLQSIAASIPGSGILATTVAGSLQSTLGNILVEAPNGNITANQGGILQIAFNGRASASATTEILAGYELRDSGGNRVSAQNLESGTAVKVSAGRNIDASGSGVIAQKIIAKATGTISGLFVGTDINIDAPKLDKIITFQTDPSSPGPQITGDAGPDPIISISKDGTTGVPAPTAAKEVAQAADNADTATTKTERPDDTKLDVNAKKIGNGISLAQKVSRVTVELPGTKKLSEKAGVGNPL